MKERPILFSAPMVSAILDGRKTQTRRIVRIPEIVRSEGLDNGLTTIEWLDKHESGPGFYAWMTEYPDEGSASVKCPYGIPGDRLWVRETWGYVGGSEYLYQQRSQDLGFRADWNALDPIPGGKWRPSIHMPRWASRLTLEITEIRVQRLQEISEEDAKAEGITRRDPLPDDYGRNLPCSHCGQRKSQHVGTVRACFGSHGEIFNSGTFKGGFSWLWDSINGAGSWAANPWVWCVSFKKVPA